MLDSLSWKLLGRGAKGEGHPRRAFVHALLGIYERYGVYVGGQLLYSDLVREWPTTNFRAADLESAIDDALDWKMVSLADGDAGPAVVLLSPDIPLTPGASAAQHLRERAADRALRLQRARLAQRDPWDGIERRHSHRPTEPQ
jgi:hypothetical protein